jgi:glycine/D-amino acid oxidase-like deaminating enzyme
LDKCGGYELLPASYGGLAQINDALAWLNKRFKQITGVENTFVRNDARLAAFKFTGFAGLLENQLEAGVHSGKLVQALTKKVLGLGVEIITSAAVTRWQPTSAGVTVTTSQGYVFTAKQLLFCTNAYTSGLVNSLQVTPARGQIVLTAPVENLAFTGTFHFDEGYYYFRNVGNRVLLGGARNMAVEEETTTALETTELIQEELERFLKEHILRGQPFVIDKRWSGIMGFTPNKLPGVIKVAANIHAVNTCNGMGVALAPVMAETAAAMVLA